ncbi:MAG: type I-B CRISPR-associated endonuclease Cas1b, partial [Thermoplasmata archaeon]
MKQDYYIVKNGVLTRKENTVYFEHKEGKRAIPVKKIYSIYAYGRLTISSGVVSYLSKHGVPIHFFNYYGWYEGSFYPREQLLSGDLTVKQAAHYLDNEKRIHLAKRFVEGATGNVLKNLQYYGRTRNEIKRKAEAIKEVASELPSTRTIPEIMHVEGSVRDAYYKALDKLFPEKYRIVRRTRMPPENKMNTLISFGNSLVYTTVLSEIYNTQLNPTISFLHEPSERRFSLSLDVAEIF